MIRTLLLLFALSILSFSPMVSPAGVDVPQLFNKVRKAYAELDMVVVKAEMKLYKNAETQIPDEQISAVYKLMDSCLLYNLGDYVFLSNKKMQLYVNNEDKVVELYRPQPVKFIQLIGMDTMLNKNIDIVIKEDSKHYVVQGKFKEGDADNKKSMLYINKKTYMVDRLIMYTKLYDYNDDFTQAPTEQNVRFEISYSIDLSPELKEKDFSESLFIDYKSPKHVTPARALTGYKIINHLN